MENKALNVLREAMRKENMAAFLVPIADPHNDEYIPEHWQYLKYLTGFTGSAATAIVTQKEALLWTDSRYWLQAEEELRDSGFKLMKDGAEGVPSPIEWYSQSGTWSDEDGDPQIWAPGDMVTTHQCFDALDFLVGINPTPPEDDFIDKMWPERPPMPESPIYPQPAQWVKETAAEKLEKIFPLLKKWAAKGTKHIVFNDPADIAWLLNLRGSDVECNPVFIAFLICDVESKSWNKAFTLFTHIQTLTPEARSQMEECGVELRPYADIAKAIPLDEEFAGDDSQLPCWIPLDEGTWDKKQPLQFLRAIKDECEIKGFREAMERDGVALVKFLRWLDGQKLAGTLPTELGIDRQLTAFRKEQPEFEQLSFPTIAAYGSHGAIVHYEPTPETDRQLEPHGFLLLDSGAQFPCGTTDITRTLPLGPLTEEERKVYTLVFKGHLALQRQHFPLNATGLQIDLAARQYMWNAGYDYGHGTGHGVGAHLCVHEGPHQIRKNDRDCTRVPLQAHMTVTDEPGIYVEGKFGVRIENTLLTVPAETTPFGKFLRFEPLTLCPYQLEPVISEMLTNEEKEQINDYHAEVMRRLMPHLTDPADRQWLENACKPII